MMTTTETKTYKKTNTKTKAHRFKILYWLSSCDVKDKDKSKTNVMHFLGCLFFRGKYFSGVNIFQELIFFRDKYFLGVNIFG